ncbi:hypothetical protein KI387_001198, partial [Taxus chinensis]
MDLSSAGNMKTRFRRLGRALKHLPPSKDELPKILEEAASCLVTIEQDGYGSMLLARDSLLMQLAKHELLDHENGEVFFDVICNDHAQEIMISMFVIMSLISNVYESPPTHLLSMLEDGLDQETSCLAHTLAQGVLEKCSNKVKTMIFQGMNSLVSNDKILVSNTCMRVGICTEKSDLSPKEEKVEKPLDTNEQGKELFLIEEVSLPLHDCMHVDKIIMGDEPKREEKSNLRVCMDKQNEDSQEVTNEYYLVVTNATWIGNECKDEGMNDMKEEETLLSTLDHSQLVGPYGIVVHMQRKIVKEEQPRLLLSDQTQASKGQPRVDLNMALKGSISPYLPHKRKPFNNYVEVTHYSKFDLASTNDEVIDEHVHAKKEKSDLKDSIHLHHESFEGQEGSMSLMVTPSHFLHDISIGEGEKGGLYEENNGGKSIVLNSEILSFVDAGGSPRYDFSYLFPPYMLSFDEYEYDHVSRMDK